MRHLKISFAMLIAVSAAGCGGGSTEGQRLQPKFSAQLTFGDSLSDVGSYAVGAVKTAGGGKYTINGDNTAVNPALTGKNWTELMAVQFKLPAPCAAQTGLNGDAASGFSVAVTSHAGCFGYAQGGARVTNSVGPGNAQTGSSLGQLTVPVATQIANHLAASGGKFKGDEIVFVMAGGPDAISQLDLLAADATAAGNAAAKAEADRVGRDVFALTLTGLLLKEGLTSPTARAVAAALQAETANPAHTPQSLINAAVSAAASQPGEAIGLAWSIVLAPMIAAAQAEAAAASSKSAAAAGAKAAADYVTANGSRTAAAMNTAAVELADLVKTQILGKGAKYVVVNSMPDLTITPFAMAQPSSTQTLIRSMVAAFNDQLKATLSTQPGVLYLDLGTVSREHASNGAAAGLTNTTTPACGSNLLGKSSLVCNASNVIGGDISHYMFADDLHPTPFEYSLIAKYVGEQMIIKGWL
jgi:outer membrane lipase/esterase